MCRRIFDYNGGNYSVEERREMADFKSSVIIERPVADVFKYASSMENVPEIMPNVVNVEKKTAGPIGVGSKFVETRLIRGKEAKADIEFIEYTENRSYTTRSESNGLEVIYEYDFQEIEEGTQVQFAGTVNTKGIVMKLTKRFLVKMLKQEDGYQLRYLKEALEGRKEEV
jgi:hypothetical protein